MSDHDVLVVLRGNPTDDELAALVVALTVTARRPELPGAEVPDRGAAPRSRQTRYVSPASWARPATTIWARDSP